MLVDPVKHYFYIWLIHVQRVSGRERGLNKELASQVSQSNNLWNLHIVDFREKAFSLFFFYALLISSAVQDRLWDFMLWDLHMKLLGIFHLVCLLEFTRVQSLYLH